MPEPLIRAYRGDVPPVRELVQAAARAREATGSPAQFLRADRLYGREHLERAAELAEAAFREGRNAAEDTGLEILLYAAGERQIKKALTKLGLQPGAAREVAAIALGERAADALDAVAAELGWTRDDALLRPRTGALDMLDVSAAEREMLPRDRWIDLVLERVALTDLWKG